MPSLRRASLLLASLAAIAAVSRPATPADPTIRGGALIIYDEGSRREYAAFEPSGYMPDGNGVSVAADWKENPHSGSSCLRFGYTVSAGPWVGVYFLAGGAWGEKPGVNVYEVLGAAQGQALRLSWWARSDDAARMEFKIGGVDRGARPDSIKFPKTTGFQRLTKHWKRYSISLAGSGVDLSNLVGGFCIVTNAAQNPGKDEVSCFVDDVRIEKAGAPAPPKKEILSRLDSTIRWAAYSPTGADPMRKPPSRPSVESIEADLKVLAPYAEGLVTYGCNDGLDVVPSVARRLGFRGMIQGVWNPKDSGELEAAIALAEDGLLDAICCGNEGLRERYQAEELRAAISELRSRTAVLVTTTEQIEDYDDAVLRDDVDFLFPNIHPIWHQIVDPRAGATWLGQKIAALRTLAPGKLILVKETGFPSGPAPVFTPEGQKDFWMAALAEAKTQKVSLVLFEAFDASWKREPLPGGADVGASWGLFGADRTPKPAAALFKSR